jgi:hypothetical protein
MENVATYSEARSEYTKQLATFIVPSVVSWFQQLWQRNSSDRQRAMALFQTECEEIPRWNQDRIHDEVRLLIERTGCDYMEELMTAVFVAHTKVLTAVRLSSKQKKLSITVPKLDHFIHRVFREAARCYWKTPFLFMAEGGVVERQKNILQIEALANEAITTAVRSLLPVKQILKDYLGDDQEEIEEDELEAMPTQKAGFIEEAPPAPVEEVPTVAEPVVQPEPEVEVVPEVTKVQEPEPEVKEMVHEQEVVGDDEKIVTTSVVKIDTEPAVSFSEYDTVFDETKGAPSMRYAPKEDADDDDMSDMPADGLLEIDDSSASSIGGDDVEDLEKPIKLDDDGIDDADLVVLE